MEMNKFFFQKSLCARSWQDELEQLRNDGFWIKAAPAAAKAERKRKRGSRRRKFCFSAALMI